MPRDLEFEARLAEEVDRIHGEAYADALDLSQQIAREHALKVDAESAARTRENLRDAARVSTVIVR